MPSAHTAYRPHPEVELLGSRPVTVREAIRGLEEAVANGAEGAGVDQDSMPGSTLITYRQIPRVLESLRAEWSAEVPEAERPTECFAEVRGRLRVHLHPCFLGKRLLEGMRQAAGSLLMRYSRALKHVPLGFKQLIPAGTHAALVGESAYVHFLIEFLAIGLLPQSGQRLLGKLGTVQTAVGANFTILGNFNSFVSKWDLPEGSWFDTQQGCWMLNGEERLGAKPGPICLEISQSVQETSGFHPVNFKSVLASHKPTRPPQEDRGAAQRDDQKQPQQQQDETTAKKRTSQAKRLSAGAQADGQQAAVFEKTPKSKRKREEVQDEIEGEHADGAQEASASASASAAPREAAPKAKPVKARKKRQEE